jgi:PAS domain-containing protein
MGVMSGIAADIEMVAGMGHNGGPAVRPYDAIKAHVDDLYAEAKNWLDGDPIKTPEQAAKVEQLLDMIREAEKAADDARKLENKPFDEGKAEVQERYNILIGKTKSVTGKTVLAADACKAALKPWREARETEARAAAEEARRVAEEAAQRAVDAARAAAADDLSAREDAEALIKQADQAASALLRAEKDATKGHGLRTTYRPILTNGVEAARHFWATRRDDCERFFTGLAAEEVRGGKRQIPGFDVVADRSAV